MPRTAAPHVQIRGDKVFDYRGEYKLTQAAFAKLVGVHPNTITRLERTNSANAATLMAIARVMRMSSNQLRAEVHQQQDHDEQQWLELYRHLSPTIRAALLGLAQELLKELATPGPGRRRRRRQPRSKDSK